jgi:hypothetical protein
MWLTTLTLIILTLFFGYLNHFDTFLKTFLIFFNPTSQGSVPDQEA